MTQPILNRSMTGVEWATLLGLSVVWGGSFFFVGVAVKELPPFTIVATRVTLAALALHILVRVAGVRLPGTAGFWLAIFGLGFLNNAVPFSLLVWGQTQITSSLASILNATTPLFAVVVAHAFTKDERLTASRALGVLVGFSGVVVMVGGAALQSLGTAVLAQIACLGAALSYALAGVYAKRFRGTPPMAIATGQLTASATILFPIVILVDQPWTLAQPSLEAAAAVLALALVSTALAYIFFFRLLASAGAVNITLVTFLVPMTAILLGVLILDDRLEWKHFAGMTLIALGLAAIDGRVGRAIAGLKKPSSIV